jgi:PAS domain S-box-containing protein
MNDLVIILNKQEEIISVNKSTLKLLKFKKNDLVNSSLKSIIKLPDKDIVGKDKVFETDIFKGLSTKGLLNDIEIDLINSSGENIPMNFSISAMYNNNILEGFVLVGRDLSDIKNTLKEKEMLLREVHHRVKNNLQLISSLLDLQSEQTKNKDINEMFRESQNRIKLIASLHEQLYQSKNLEKIDLNNHIQNLLDNLFSSYKINPNNISLKITIQDIFLDFKTSLLISMIISELVSNSLKHAFPKGKKGEIKINIKSDNNRYKLSICDNGIGFPKNLDFKNTKTLGLQLINMFVKQLKGNIQLDRSNGTKYIITFIYIESQ